MRPIPIIATLVVALAIAVMIRLGVWQLERAEWKEELLARYAANASLDPVAFDPAAGDALLYRPAFGDCLPPIKWSSRAGRARSGEGGWRHLATCRDGRTFDMGWSTNPGSPVGWTGGLVMGLLDADRDHGLILVAEAPAPGLESGARPSPAAIPNNHRSYAGQWFLFAGIAALIYVLALRRKLAARGTDG